MRDTRKLRRQVAWLCFEPHLPTQQRLDAVQILERGFQIDGAMNMISYISKVCNEFGIDEEARKTLYLQFHQMMTNPPELTEDPLAQLLEREQSKLSAARQKTETEPSVAAALLPPEPQPTPQRRELPAHTVMFSLLVHQVVDLCGQTDELFSELKDLVLEDKQQATTLIVLIVEWSNNPDSFRWAYDLDETMLTKLVHFIYMAACHILGPVEADRCFHKALAACEKRPEAKQFSPSKFL